MPAIEASRSTASGNETPSVFITKSKMLPFRPDEKSNHACFSSLTKKDGVFSCWNGDSPLNSRPAFFSFTRRPTTSEAGSRARSSSRNWGVKRMGECVPSRRPVPTEHGYRDQPVKSEVCPVSPGYSQRLAASPDCSLRLRWIDNRNTYVYTSWESGWPV